MRKVVCNLCTADWGIQHSCLTRGAVPTVIYEPDPIKSEPKANVRSEATDLELLVSDFLPDGCGIGHANDCPTIKFVERANKILREKLEKAPVVRSCKYHGAISTTHWTEGTACEHCEQTARLVCIKSLEEGTE